MITPKKHPHIHIRWLLPTSSRPRSTHLLHNRWGMSGGGRFEQQIDFSLLLLIRNNEEKRKDSTRVNEEQIEAERNVQIQIEHPLTSTPSSRTAQNQRRMGLLLMTTKQNADSKCSQHERQRVCGFANKKVVACFKTSPGNNNETDALRQNGSRLFSNFPPEF